MKSLLLLFFISITTWCSAQTDLSTNDTQNLVKIAELFANKSNQTTNAEFIKRINDLRTPTLNTFIDQVLFSSKIDEAIMSSPFQKRPNNKELAFWYAMGEVSYNNNDTTKTRRTTLKVVESVLKNPVDERAMLIQYYDYLHFKMGILLSNNIDLSKYNFDLDKMGFKNDTEKAIFYFSLVSNLLTGEFEVLTLMKKMDVIVQKSKMVPTINGKAYYEFQSFDFPDFNYTGYDTPVSFKKKKLDATMVMLMNQYSALVKVTGMPSTVDFYNRSLLSNPAYFIYGGAEDTLKSLYEKRKK